MRYATPAPLCGVCLLGRGVAHKICAFSLTLGKAAACPAVWGGSRVEFNVPCRFPCAHRVISDCGAVGVDIERCDPSPTFRSLELQVLSARERQMDAGRQPGFFARALGGEGGGAQGGRWRADHLQRLSVEQRPAAGDDCRYRLHDVEPALAPVGRAWRPMPLRDMRLPWPARSTTSSWLFLRRAAVAAVLADRLLKTILADGSTST